MQYFPETRDSLLVRIQDAADRVAWEEFTAIYRPLIYRIARRRGLQDADAHDLTQKVLMSVASKIGQWEPDQQRCHFRTWLTRVAQNAIIDMLRQIRPDTARGGTSVLAELEQQPEPTEVTAQEFQREHQRAVFRSAAGHVRHEFEERTWQAFWLTAVEGRSVSSVAGELGTSDGAIYTARSRVMQRLKAKVSEHTW